MKEWSIKNMKVVVAGAEDWMVLVKPCNFTML